MNERQREVQMSLLNDEQEYIRQLKEIYEQASRDCDDKIRQLSARSDLENIQSIVYQQQYQEILKKQIDEALINLQSNEYSDMSDYLENCYKNSFTGTLYDLHGQGVPLLFPIDQSQVVKAVQLDSKISKGLYTRLGEDVNKLKDLIRSEVSRGIANGSTWNQTASYLAMGMKSPFNKAYNNAVRIARTEGHRIQNQAQADTLNKAKTKGADVVKQWDSTLDDVTRDTHKALDGQIREIDEPFEVNGLTAMQPGGFGDPAEDCNCRCCMLQRAKWELGESELKELQDRAEYFGLDKAENFEEFKNKYMNGVANSGESGIIKVDKNSLSTYIGKEITETDNQHVREWYYANVSDIPNQIDKSKPFEEQVKQAFELRNQYKHEARVAMSDTETANMLEKKRPAPTFENLLRSKMERKGLTREEALEDILKTASKTNSDVNKEFGL